MNDFSGLDHVLKCPFFAWLGKPLYSGAHQHVAAQKFRVLDALSCLNAHQFRPPENHRRSSTPQLIHGHSLNCPPWLQ
jgi:hypothetical protein